MNRADFRQKHQPLLRALMLRAAVLSVLWWALSHGEAESWPMGSIIISVALAISLRLAPPVPARFSLASLAGFMVFFLYQSLKGGAQVALMALRPRLDVQPTMIDIDLRLQDETARAFLVVTLSLLPGTLSTRLEGSRLSVHLIDRRLPLEQEIRDAETYVARLLNQELP